MALKLADAEFSEVRREQVREIARAYGVPPASLFKMSRATWSNYEQAQREILTGTLRPWIARWQAAYARCLLTPDERAVLYVEGNPDDMLAVDHAARATAFSQYRSMGVLTGNEVRASMNRPPLPGGDELSNPFTSTGATPAPAPASPTQDHDAWPGAPRKSCSSGVPLRALAAAHRAILRARRSWRCGSNFRGG